MSERAYAKATGPIDDYPNWPAQLDARVVTPGAAPRIHGYDVETDLAPNYPFVHTLLLALTGELPTDGRAAMLDMAMQMLAPVSVAEAPAHAAVLAQLCCARPSGLIAAVAITLAEQARHLVDGHQDLLAWLADPRGQLPERHRAPEEPPLVAQLRSAAAAWGVKIPALEAALPTKDAALLATLHACGVTQPGWMEVVILVARLPCVAAEGFAAPKLGIREYPMTLPPFLYEAP